MSTPISTSIRPTTAAASMLLLLSVFGVASAGSARMALAPGEAAPALKVQAYPTGSVVTFKYDDHRLTAVNFWATWCQPCALEMPALQRLEDRFGEDGFRVIGVYDERVSWKRILDAVTPLGVRYQLARALNETDPAWGGVKSLPTTFLVDAEGRIVRRYVGATEPQIAGMVADVEAFLDGRPLPDMVLPDPDSAVIDPGTTAGQAASGAGG